MSYSACQTRPSISYWLCSQTLLEVELMALEALPSCVAADADWLRSHAADYLRGFEVHKANSESVRGLLLAVLGRLLELNPSVGCLTDRQMGARMHGRTDGPAEQWMVLVAMQA
jgi:hypothetical protein